MRGHGPRKFVIGLTMGAEDFQNAVQDIFVRLRGGIALDERVGGWGIPRGLWNWTLHTSGFLIESALRASRAACVLRSVPRRMMHAECGKKETRGHGSVTCWESLVMVNGSLQQALMQ